MKWLCASRNIIITLMLLAIYQPASADTRLLFPDACAEGDSIVIAAVGDVLIHTPLRIKGNQLGYESLWEEAIPYLKRADIAYANLEGPIAPGQSEPGSRGRGNVYTAFPYFNYPPALASGLKNSGIDIVSTANNHALDRYSIGIDKTIETLDEVGLPFTGTRARNSNRSFIYIVSKKNFKVAWISCTEHTNGIDDNYKQVLFCYKKKDRKLILNTIQELKNQVDAIIVTPHWGEEYQHKPTEEQILFAHQVLNAGATAVIGSHPHVLQPMQKYITPDGRNTFIMYSLGNFVSFQGSADKRSTVILLLGLTKTEHGTIINGVRFVPMYMENRSGLGNIHLSRLPQPNHNDLSPSTISSIMPMGNVIYSNSIITNPECYLPLH